MAGNGQGYEMFSARRRRDNLSMDLRPTWISLSGLLQIPDLARRLSRKDGLLGAVFGTAIGAALLAAILWASKVTDAGYLVACMAAFLLLSALRLTHLVVVFCS